MAGEAPSPVADAWTAAAVFAVDPVGTGVSLRAAPGPLRDRWLAWLRALWPIETPLRRVPAGVSEDRLLGGIDLAATLATGRVAAERGLLAEVDGGALILSMAERMPVGVAGVIAAALDTGTVAAERDGIGRLSAARFGVVALDEGIEDEQVPPAIADRLGMQVMFDAHATPAAPTLPPIAVLRARLSSVTASDGMIDALCAAALALGVSSLRAPLQALRVARAAAVVAGRDRVEDADLALAARLVLAPRATRLPPHEHDEPETPPQQAEPEAADGADAEDSAGRSIEDVVLAAARAALPVGLLAALQGGALRRSAVRSQGRSGVLRRASRRGRPAGTKAGSFRSGARLALVDTLRAAAPWQTVRRLEVDGPPRRVIVRRDDIRLVRLKAPSQTTTIFAVDASGSAALARLAEAKGAVELLLQDCYVRRDTVALIAFRGGTAELVLPPTGSLARARRCLAGLAGGGGTPLASAIDLVGAVVDGIARRGRRPVAVLLTDGHANVARDGTPGRPRAESDALDAARRLRAMGPDCLLIDTASRPQPAAKRVAEAMGARYLALPCADAASLGKAVRAGVAGHR